MWLACQLVGNIEYLAKAAGERKIRLAGRHFRAEWEAPERALELVGDVEASAGSVRGSGMAPSVRGNGLAVDDHALRGTGPSPGR